MRSTHSAAPAAEASGNLVTDQDGEGNTSMKFGILFTSHPHVDKEPYPHREVHARVTAEILEADRLGYDIAWIAEHHFSNGYGILPDPFTYIGYLAALTRRIRLGTAVMTLPLYNPVRVVENTAFADILSEGRFILGLGSGYRPYEFEGMGVPFDERRDIQEEALEIVLDALHNRRIQHQGTYFNVDVSGDYEIFPASIQDPHVPLYLAAGTDRSIGVAARHGCGLMLSTLPGFDKIATQTAYYREALKEAPEKWQGNPAYGHVDQARWVYVAESDAKAKEDSAEGLIHHIKNFMAKNAAGYLGTVSEKDQGGELDYDELAATTLLHGSPDTVIRRLQELRDVTGITSLVLHYPPYYGVEKTLNSLRLFAEEVIPAFRTEAVA